jgi:hypothetical protein
MAEQDAKLVHQLPEFLASQGFQFLQQAAPIEAAAVVIAQAVDTPRHGSCLAEAFIAASSA